MTYRDLSNVSKNATIPLSKAHTEPFQTTTMELPVKILRSLEPVTIFAKMHPKHLFGITYEGFSISKIFRNAFKTPSLQSLEYCEGFKRFFGIFFLCKSMGLVSI